MKLLAWCPAGLLLLALAGCGGREITRNSLPMIQGQLTEGGTQHSLGSVLVTLRVSGVYTTTDGDGYYEFHSLPDGPETLVVDQSPWDRLEIPIRLTEGQTLVQDLVLQRDLVLPWLDLDPDSLDFGWDGESAPGAGAQSGQRPVGLECGPDSQLAGGKPRRRQRAGAVDP
jgi:hypothetical protein